MLATQAYSPPASTLSLLKHLAGLLELQEPTLWYNSAACTKQQRIPSNPCYTWRLPPGCQTHHRGGQAHLPALPLTNNAPSPYTWTGLPASTNCTHCQGSSVCQQQLWVSIGISHPHIALSCHITGVQRRMLQDVCQLEGQTAAHRLCLAVAPTRSCGLALEGSKPASKSVELQPP